MYDIVYINLSDDTSGYDTLKQLYPHAILISDCSSIIDALQRATKVCYTNMVWIVSDNWTTSMGDILSWRPWSHDKLVPYYWSAESSDLPDIDSIKQGNTEMLYSGSYLLPLNYISKMGNTFDNVAVITGDNPGSLPFDIFFVSYNEPNADANWKLLSDRFPTAKRVHGIKGIDNAHRHCAVNSTSGMFWTVDADTVVHDTFMFDYIPVLKERSYLYIWHSLNPVNGLDYGWGAIKLWPTHAVLEFDGNWLDFTTTVGNIRMVTNVVATNAFNTDTWSAWRSGFREAVKLCVNVANGDVSDSLQRLYVWLTVANPVDYAADTRSGAVDGLEFYLSTSCIADLKLINDFDKLQLLFDRRVSRTLYTDTVENLVAALKAHQIA
jgi:hypothetical protein